MSHVGKRYRWDNETKRLVELSDDWRDRGRVNQGPVTEEIVYGGASAVEADPETKELRRVAVNTRKKHREYMKRNGLTTADDFTQQWEKQTNERLRARGATHGDDPYPQGGYLPQSEQREIREAIGKAWYKARKE